MKTQYGQKHLEVVDLIWTKETTTNNNLLWPATDIIDINIINDELSAAAAGVTFLKRKTRNNMNKVTHATTASRNDECRENYNQAVTLHGKPFAAVINGSKFFRNDLKLWLTLILWKIGLKVALLLDDSQWN